MAKKKKTTPAAITQQEVFVKGAVQGATTDPITETEKFIADVVAGSDPTPKTHDETFIKWAIENASGPAPTLIEKTITANGDYSASADNADGYSSVHASVPNSYTDYDEGKVVSNGSLVSQTPATYTSNNTYDTTTVNSVTVNVIGDRTEIRSLIGRTIVSYTDDGLTSLGERSFSNCTNLTSLTVHGVTSVQSYAIYSSGLSKLALPSLQEVPGAWGLGGCSGLEILDVGNCTSFAGTYTFRGNNNMTKLIIRSTTPFQMSNVSQFINTPFANGGSGGEIYIPHNLYIALGTTTTNDLLTYNFWYTLNSYGTITWKDIQGSYYETHYGDDTLIPTP